MRIENMSYKKVSSYSIINIIFLVPGMKIDYFLSVMN